MKYKFYIEYEIGDQNRREFIITSSNTLEAISLVIGYLKKNNFNEWEKNPLGMISVKARIPIDEQIK